MLVPKCKVLESRLRPLMDPRLDVLWQEYLIADTATRQTLGRTLRVMLAQRLRESFDSEYVLLRPPSQEIAGGEYPVGEIYYGKNGFYAFGLREREFIQHIRVFGRSGSGKTNLAYLLLLGFVRASQHFLVFDWKRNYRDLTALPEFADFLIFTVGRDVAPFRFNPLIPPPGTPPTVWLKKLIEIMCHAYFLGEGVTVLLMRAIDHLYREAGLYKGKRIAFEIEAGKSNAVSSVCNCLDAGMDKVIAVTASRSAKDALTVAFHKHPRVACVTCANAARLCVGSGLAM